MQFTPLTTANDNSDHYGMMGIMHDADHNDSDHHGEDSDHHGMMSMMHDDDYNMEECDIHEDTYEECFDSEY
ncbi:MAG: hypothetical protein ACXAC8_07725 [Candidatus Hodarchaeales archaeon]